jgi:hypothetical protein
MRRQQLTEAQIAALFDPPTNRRTLLRSTRRESAMWLRIAIDAAERSACARCADGPRIVPAGQRRSKNQVRK